MVGLHDETSQTARGRANGVVKGNLEEDAVAETLMAVRGQVLGLHVHAIVWQIAHGVSSRPQLWACSSSDERTAEFAQADPGGWVPDDILLVRRVALQGNGRSHFVTPTNPYM